MYQQHLLKKKYNFHLLLKKNLLQILSKHFIQHQMMIFNSSEVWVWWQNSFGMKFNSLLIQLCRFYPSSKGKLRLGVIFLCQAFIIALTKKKTKTTSQPEYIIFDSSTRAWSTDRIGTKCLGKGPATKSDEFDPFCTMFLKNIAPWCFWRCLTKGKTSLIRC